MLDICIKTPFVIYFVEMSSNIRRQRNPQVYWVCFIWSQERVREREGGSEGFKGMRLNSTRIKVLDFHQLLDGLFASFTAGSFVVNRPKQPDYFTAPYL